MFCVVTLYHMDANTAAALVSESWCVDRAGGSVYIVKAVSPIAQVLVQAVGI